MLALAGLSGCTLVYKLDIPQGNLVDKSQVDSLKPGMTRRQVSLIMGTPSIQDPFHQNRWDYAASYQRRGGDIEIKNLTLYFDNDVLAKLEGAGFVVLDRLVTGLTGDTLEERSKAFRELARGLKPGVTELIVHLAGDDEEIRHISGAWRNRFSDFQIVTDRDTRAFLEAEGVKMIGYRELGRLWKP